MVFDIQKVCRVCLKEDISLTDIFCILRSSSPTRKYQKNLPLKLQCVTSQNVQEDDGLPHMLCRDCLFRLNIAFYFQQEAKSSEVKLRQYLYDIEQARLKIKIESAEDIEYYDNFEVVSSDNADYVCEPSVEAIEAPRQEDKSLRISDVYSTSDSETTNKVLNSSQTVLHLNMDSITEILSSDIHGEVSNSKESFSTIITHELDIHDVKPSQDIVNNLANDNITNGDKRLGLENKRLIVCLYRDNKTERKVELMDRNDDIELVQNIRFPCKRTKVLPKRNANSDFRRSVLYDGSKILVELPTLIPLKSIPVPNKVIKRKRKKNTVQTAYFKNKKRKKDEQIVHTRHFMKYKHPTFADRENVSNNDQNSCSGKNKIKKPDKEKIVTNVENESILNERQIIKKEMKKEKNDLQDHQTLRPKSKKMICRNKTTNHAKIAHSDCKKKRKHLNPCANKSYFKILLRPKKKLKKVKKNAEAIKKAPKQQSIDSIFERSPVIKKLES